MTHTHVTAPTQFVEWRGNQFAYRRLGATEGVPVVFLQHFTGTMDYWDPALVDGFARERPVILFDNTGIGSSSGETPATVREMAPDAVAFIDALGLQQVDLLGFSLGGFVAQVLAAEHPHRVRRLILVGYWSRRRRRHQGSRCGPRSGTTGDSDRATAVSVLRSHGRQPRGWASIH